MKRRGRPPAGSELKAVRAQMHADRERTIALVAALPNRSPLDELIWLAATILNSLEHGKRVNQEAAVDATRKLRNSEWGRSLRLSSACSSRHFAEAFLVKFAPDWNWPAQRDKGADNEREQRLITELAQ